MTENIRDTVQSIPELAQSILPRVLTQACRDPFHPAYGCFDRNWWHYQIRDFPSIILQQGAYSVFLAASLPGWVDQADGLIELAKAGCRFWNKRATRPGAFEEYYPNEQGYPPLAFSTLAILKITAHFSDLQAEIRNGVCNAARQLSQRFENKAANQQIAGLAALAYIHKLYPQFCSSTTLSRIKTESLHLQDQEGWFHEYAGPDLGYLSVTLDCLWDLYDLTQDTDFLYAANKAFSFLATVIRSNHGNIGMHNSRNTDYLVPYGILRFLSEPGFESQAGSICSYLFSACTQPEHFFAGIDDRYFCHYVGHSLVRSALLLTGGEVHANNPQEQENGNNPSFVSFPNSGYLILNQFGKGLNCMVSLKKGGILTAKNGEAYLSDFGWVILKGNSQYLSHWWNEQWTSSFKIDQEKVFISITGKLVFHKDRQSTPLMHLMLRILSKLLGYKIISTLKNVLIFKNKYGDFDYSRLITVYPNKVTVEDNFKNIDEDCTILKAPRSSKRLVASADSYHPEDFKLINHVTATASTIKANREMTIFTEYQIPT